jgi:hypothetical protein
MSLVDWFLLLGAGLLWLVALAFVICVIVNQGQRTRPQDDEHWIDEIERDFESHRHK